jgi:hypothetical protein
MSRLKLVLLHATLADRLIGVVLWADRCAAALSH